MIRTSINYSGLRLSFITLFFLLIISGNILAAESEAEKARSAAKKAEKAEKAKADKELQDQLLRREVMGFVKANYNREAGEGWLFLAHHYRELKDTDRAMLYLRTLLRSEHINPRLTWEAMLLNADINVELKKFDIALKELEKLIALVPAREYLIRAKIARAKILGRTITTVKDLQSAFYKYFRPFPEKPDIEAIEYIMGFERGYDLEIAMMALEAWEEISRFPEKEASERASINIALLHAFDLNNPKRALPFIEKVLNNQSPEPDAIFVHAVLKHLYLKDSDNEKTLELYTEFRNRSDTIEGYRVAGILQAQLLTNELGDHDSAINTLHSFLEVPQHLVASESVSVQKRQQNEDEQIDWARLACRMAGYICEFRLNNLDRAQYYYRKSEDLNKERNEPVEDHYVAAALKRTEPSVTKAQLLFEMAYEKYRSQKYIEALQLFEEFTAENKDHYLYREALFRMAVINDDDLRRYSKALELYENFLIDYAPIKSTWKLDTLYDWGRIDEVSYRIGNLKSLHLKQPVAALEIFARLASTYPDSYWAMQGLKDSIKIYSEDLGDPDKAYELMQNFISSYPETSDASDYRLRLYRVFLQKAEQIKALHILRDYLDHAMPSEKNFFSLKQQWRDLAFTIREERLRQIMKYAGPRDTTDLYLNLIDVVSLASGSAPLEKLVEEIKGLEINDELRWSLVYEAGTRMYQNFPDKSGPVFSDLANNATGPAQIACLLTLGNIAYRVDRNVDEAVKWYERARVLLPLTDARAEQLTYRLGRLYLVQGHGLKGLEQLRLFTVRFPSSRYLVKAYIAMADACVALNNPERGLIYYRRALRVAPEMADKIKEKIVEAEKLPTSAQWLKQRAMSLKERVEIEEEKSEVTETNRQLVDAAEKIKDSAALTEDDLPKYTPEQLYGLFLEANADPRVNGDRLALFLSAVLKRDKVDTELRQRALRQFISTRFFRFRKAENFVEEAQQILSRHNYADWQPELLFRMAQAQDHFLKDYVAANRAYFEYLSFYPLGKRVEEVRRRIPEVYARAGDKKNAVRFFERLIDDSMLPDQVRVDASMKLARNLILDDKKNEAIKVLTASLIFKSDKGPEICLRLERMTEDFAYVRRALDLAGEESFRLKALQRLIAKSEEDNDYLTAATTLRDYIDSFKEPEAKVWIERKTEELSKRGVIEEIEDLIDKYPEEVETAGRMFKLAKLVEGAENTRYRSEDLFYEITLVYPNSQYYRESKIRAENTRAIRAAAELGDMLKKGTKGRESEEVIIERARLFQQHLKDLKSAGEALESFVELFPESPRLGEVYLSLGQLELAESGDSVRALELWEKGLAATRDPQIREDLTGRINGLKIFQEKVIFSDRIEDNEKGLEQVFRVWRLENDHLYALGLLENAINKLENRPDVALYRYFAGRIYEQQGNNDKAIAEYNLALRSLYHRGLRKDMVLYRMARLYAKLQNSAEAARYYVALISRYPRSLLSRSAFYWLYKHALDSGDINRAHHYLETLIQFKALNPIHREEIARKIKEVEAQVNIAEMKRLRKTSSTGGAHFPYFMGKVLENSLRDYDKAIKQYEDFLKTNPPVRQSREVMLKIADLFEKKGDYVKTVGYLDLLLNTYKPSVTNFDLIIRIGSLVEDQLKNQELTELFFSSIVAEYKDVRKVRVFAEQKLKRIEEQKREKAKKPRSKKIVKRVYSEDDEFVVEELEAIIERQIEELQDFRQAERQMEDLWDDNMGSLATLDIMQALVELNMKQMMDPQKAGMYYQRWLDENPDDPLAKEYTMKLYDHYMEELRDGQKALRLLESYIREHPISLDTIDIELKLGKANELLIKNFDEARRIYLRIIDTRQNDPIVHEAYFRIGFVLREGFASYDEAIKYWQELIDSFYNNEFADKAQFAIAYTWEVYRRDYTKARQAYDKILQIYPNSTLQQQVREALLRIEGK